MKIQSSGSKPKKQEEKELSSREKAKLFALQNVPKPKPKKRNSSPEKDY